MAVDDDQRGAALADVRAALTIVKLLHERVHDRLGYDELQRLADAASALERAKDVLAQAAQRASG